MKKYSLSDVIKVFIWELPEKTTKVNTKNEFMIIRDSVCTKRIKVSLLFTYFSQNVKIEQLKETISDLLSQIDETYNPKYEVIDNFLDKYDDYINGVNGLLVRFETNKSKIDKLSVELTQCGYNIIVLEKDITKLISDTDLNEEKYGNLSDVTNDSILKESVNAKDLKSIDKSISDFESNCKSLDEDLIINNGNIDTIKDTLNSDIDSKTQKITDKLFSDYDKILSVIDHYHHIHDNPYK